MFLCNSYKSTKNIFTIFYDSNTIILEIIPIFVAEHLKYSYVVK